jgi:antitoxin component of MazEF toxin-antitoxin module
MALPAVKEVRVVDGVEVEVEVPRKRLFTFAPVERRAGVTTYG